MCDKFTYIYMEKEECIICLEATDSSGIHRSACSECHYNVHAGCWNQWVRHQRIKKCLICRKNIDPLFSSLAPPPTINDGIVLCLTTTCIVFIFYILCVIAIFHILMYLY